MVKRSGATCWIGVDAGTSGCKTVAVDESGELRAAATVGYPTHRATDGRVTQDARDWVSALRQTIRTVMASPAVPSPASVAGLAITAPAHNAVLVDGDGEPARRVLLWSDARATETAEQLLRRYGDAFFDRTLARLSPAWTLPQLAWMRHADPGLFTTARHVLVGKDYLRYVLTGEALTDPSDAAGTALYDPRKGVWLDDICTDVGLNPDLLPAIVPSDQVGGRLSRWWAQELGLQEGLPVAVGATDTAAELVSVRATEQGLGLIKIASTGTVVGVTNEPVADPRLLCYPHAVSGRWYTIAVSNTAATAYGWLCSVLGQQPPDNAGLGALEESAAAIPAGSDGLLFLPFLEGERTPYWDPRLRASFIGLSSGHTSAHCVRSVLEGVAYALRTGRDLLEDVGVSIRSPALTGGGMRSPLWRSVLLAALGMSGRVVEPCGPAYGAAMLAGAATGVPLGEPEVRRPDLVERPLVAWRETYDALYPLFLQGAEATTELSRLLVGFKEAELPAVGQRRRCEEPAT